MYEKENSGVDYRRRQIAKIYKAYAERLKKSNVKIQTNATVKQIIVEDGKIAGVKCLINGVEKTFTTKEFDLLTFLASHPNHVYTKDELFREIWDMESVGDIATVTVHIKKIREKVEIDTSNPQYIETIWGVGYRFKV